MEGGLKMTNNTGNNQAPMKDDPPRKTTNFVAQSEEESRDNFSNLKFKSSDLLVDKVGLHYFQNKISTMIVSPNNSFREGYKMERKLREEANLDDNLLNGPYRNVLTHLKEIHYDELNEGKEVERTKKKPTWKRRARGIYKK